MCLAPKPPALPPPPEPAAPPPEIIQQTQPATIAPGVKGQRRTKATVAAGTSQLKIPANSSLNVPQPAGTSSSNLNIAK
jgi:hypothetical protein